MVEIYWNWKEHFRRTKLQFKRIKRKLFVQILTKEYVASSRENPSCSLVQCHLFARSLVLRLFLLPFFSLFSLSPTAIYFSPPFSQKKREKWENLIKLITLLNKQILISFPPTTKKGEIRFLFWWTFNPNLKL